MPSTASTPSTPSTASAASTAPRSSAADQLNKDLFDLSSAGANASLQTAFEFQNAALANSQAVLETWTDLSKGAVKRWADLTRQTQVSLLESYQSSRAAL